MKTFNTFLTEAIDRSDFIIDMLRKLNTSKEGPVGGVKRQRMYAVNAPIISKLPIGVVLLPRNEILVLRFNRVDLINGRVILDRNITNLSTGKSKSDGQGEMKLTDMAFAIKNPEQFQFYVQLMKILAKDAKYKKLFVQQYIDNIDDLNKNTIKTYKV